MSYEIVYDRRFIKLSDGRIIPMVLAGSSNCYELRGDKEIRERNWWPMFIGKDHALIADTPEKIMAGVNAAIPSTYSQWWMQNGKWVDDTAFVRFFQNGIKNAKTLEEYRALYKHEEYGSVSLTLYVVFRSKSDWFKTTGNKAWLATDTAELESFIPEALEYASTTVDGYAPDIMVQFSYNRKLVLQEKKPTKPKLPLQATKKVWYSVADNDGYHFVRLTKYGYKRSMYPSKAKAFPTEKAAQSWLDKNKSRISFDNAVWFVKQHTNTTLIAE